MLGIKRHRRFARRDMEIGLLQQWAIIHTALTGLPGCGVEMPFIISSATRSEQRDQALNKTLGELNRKLDGLFDAAR